MATYWYERLAATDRPFLVFEGRHTHMHLGGTTIFDGGTLLTRQGGVDIDRIRTYVRSRLHLIPRYRQRLAYVPVEGAPVWVDDGRLNLHYHVRHTSLPRPGDESQLKRLTGRIMSQPLDRSRPLWEVWIVEGLEGGRFALVLKTHHAVVDGVSGVDLLSVLLRPEPDDSFEDPPAWIPRPAPSAAELLRDELVHRASLPLTLAQDAARRWRNFDLTTLAGELLESASATWEVVSTGLRRPATTPLNQPIGPFRRVDWCQTTLAEAKAVKNRLGGTVNDVILATVTGAVRHYLLRKGTDVEALDYKTVVPVSIRGGDEYGITGNRVAAWLLSLPIHEIDPASRYAQVVALTGRIKRSKQAQGVGVLAQVAEWFDPILTLGVRLAARMHPYNLIVTNVPGPQFPLYLLGARMLAGYPTVPLFEYQGLGIASLSYDGKLFWGLNADWDLVPDLHELAAALMAAFRELQQIAELGGPTTIPRKKSHAKRRRTSVHARA